MTESEKKQVLTLWQSGMPLTRIRQMVAVKPTEFIKGIDEMRKDGSFGGKRINTEKKVISAFDKGERNVKAIADMYGITEATVYQYLYRNNRFLGGKNRIWAHSERTLEIVDDLKEGILTQYKIAQKYGVSRQYITKIKHKLEKGILDYE